MNSGEGRTAAEHPFCCSPLGIVENRMTVQEGRQKARSGCAETGRKDI